MAAITGKVNSALTAFDADVAITAWELEANIATARKIGVPGANVASEISNGIAGLRITTEDVAVSTWAAQVDHDAAYAINSAATTAVNHGATAAIDDVGNLDASQTDVTYDTKVGTFPALPFTILIETEQMSVTADSGTVFTVTRAYNGTTGATHVDGLAIAMIVAKIDTKIEFDTLSGVHPPVPYTLKIAAELMQVTAATATVYTVTRGYDGSTAADVSDGDTTTDVVGAADTVLHVDGETGTIPTTDFTLLLGTESVLVAVASSTATKLTVTRAVDATSAATAVNNATLTQAGIGSVDTQLRVDTITGTIPTTFPFNVLVGTELMSVASFATPVLTVTRGFDGTTKAVHLDNAVVDVSVAADDITDQYGAGDVIAGVTFQTANGEAAPA